MHPQDAAFATSADARDRRGAWGLARRASSAQTERLACGAAPALLDQLLKRAGLRMKLVGPIRVGERSRGPYQLHFGLNHRRANVVQTKGKVVDQIAHDFAARASQGSAGDG